jgi:hypothetical protein
MTREEEIAQRCEKAAILYWLPDHVLALVRSDIPYLLGRVAELESENRVLNVAVTTRDVDLGRLDSKVDALRLEVERLKDAEERAASLAKYSDKLTEWQTKAVGHLKAYATAQFHHSAVSRESGVVAEVVERLIAEVKP